MKISLEEIDLAHLEPANQTDWFEDDDQKDVVEADDNIDEKLEEKTERSSHSAANFDVSVDVVNASEYLEGTDTKKEVFEEIDISFDTDEKTELGAEPDKKIIAEAQVVIQTVVDDNDPNLIHNEVLDEQDVDTNEVFEEVDDQDTSDSAEPARCSRSGADCGRGSGEDGHVHASGQSESETDTDKTIPSPKITGPWHSKVFNSTSWVR